MFVEDLFILDIHVIFFNNSKLYLILFLGSTPYSENDITSRHSLYASKLFFIQN